MRQIPRWAPSFLLGLLSLAGPTLAAGPTDCPTLTFNGSEVYLYGHGPRTVNVLSVERDTVRINGVPVFPKLREPRVQSEVVVTELGRAMFALESQAEEVEKDLAANGVPTDQRLEALADLYRSAPALVDSVTPASPGSIWVWWHGVTWAGLRSVNSSVPSLTISPSERLRHYYDEFRGLLERGNLIIITTRTDANVQLQYAEHVHAVRSEIAHARAATSALTPATWSETYLAASMAEQFRHPLRIAGGKD